MFWTVSFRNENWLPVQILEDYKTQELSFNQTIELPYSQHEADCENQMGVINRWLERKNVAKAGFDSKAANTWNRHGQRTKKSDALRRMYVADYREAKMCYEYELRELDHLIRHRHISGAERIHFIHDREPIGKCETCDKIDAANVKHYF